MEILLKLFIFSCLTTSALSAEFSRGQRNTFAAECKTELNIKDEDYAILKSREVPKNDDQSCLLECLYGKLELIKDGKIDKEVHTSISKAVYKDDQEKLKIMDEIYDKCSVEATKATGEKCSIGKNLRACVQTHFKKYEDVLKPKHSKSKAPPS